MASFNGTNQTASESRCDGSIAQDQRVSAIQECCGQVSRFAQENPATTVMTVFAVGLGIGTVVGSLIAGSQPQSATSRVNAKAEEFGRRIAAAVSDVIPDTFRS